MATQNPVNNNLIISTGGISLTNVKYPRATLNSSASGLNDVYTCPSGRRAWVGYSGLRNQNAAIRTMRPSWKISGTYYNMNSNNTQVSSSGYNFDSNDNGMILEAGETIAWDAQTSLLNSYTQIIEFDATNALKTAKIIGVTSGDNTVYTCPSGKKAIITTGNGLPLGATINGSIWVSASTAINGIIYIVPNGGSPGASNKYYGTAFASGTAKNVNIQAVLSPGDAIVFNSDVTSSTSLVAVNIVEI